jgi:hypothetical protein
MCVICRFRARWLLLPTCCRKRTQNHLNDLETRCEDKKMKIGQLQAQLRKGQQQPAGAPAAVAAQ